MSDLKRDLKLSPCEQHLYNAQLISVNFIKRDAGKACRSLKACCEMGQAKTILKDRANEIIAEMDQMIQRPLEQNPINLYKLCVVFPELLKGNSILTYTKGFNRKKVRPQSVDQALGNILDRVGFLSAEVGTAMEVQFNLFTKRKVDVI